MKANICRCNYCGAILIDNNSQSDLSKFETPKEALQMEFNKLKNCYVCPKCHTDEFLIDIDSQKMLDETISWKK